MWAKRYVVAAVLAALASGVLGVETASAATIDILWYSGGVVNFGPPYKISFDALAASSPGGNTWSITYWDSGAMPSPGPGATGGFEVLVTASGTGGWTTFPTYTALSGAIAGAGGPGSFFGDRVMHTGQDADWHYLNGCGSKGCIGTTASPFDGPRGFLTDAINWAGSGTGMGGVILDAGEISDLFTGLGTRTTNFGDNVIIPPAFAAFPINAGLTSAGISNWFSAHHAVWSGTDTTLWTGINTTPDGCVAETCFVTLVTAETAGGETTPVAEPMSLVLVGTGLAGLGAVARRRQRRK